MGLKETSPERLAEAAPEAEALLHRLPQLAGVPLAEMGSAGAGSPSGPGSRRPRPDRRW
ncbi:hypothetical protein ACFQXA_38835 [Nocardiopsis composta]